VGNPMPNIRVSVYPSIGLGYLGKTMQNQSPSKTTASSVITFSVASVARVTLSLHDLDGALIQKFIDADLLNAGMYNHVFSLQSGHGARVMRCRLSALDSSNGAVLYRDSNVVTLWQPDPSIAVMGYTSNTGTFESRDSLAFPYILTLPPILITQNDPMPVGSFLIPDSCRITLADTVNGRQMTFDTKLIRGMNEFTVTWNPVSGTIQSPERDQPPALSSLSSRLDDRTVFEWRLYQNYPNPFN
jgi:hypothetical protein